MHVLKESASGSHKSLLFIIVTSYFFLELCFNYRAALVIDEFWFAHVVYQYHSGIPYRDFAPYKTVLGYYFLLLPLLWRGAFAGSVMPVLIFTKNSLALVNALLFLGSALWLKKFFSMRAVLSALVLVIFSNTVLIYSTNIRVDLLAYWFCLFSFLGLLDRRYALAGLLLGLGFITSQKAVWFWAATQVTLVFHTLWQRQLSVSSLIKLNLTFLSIILGYALFWSVFAGWSSVLHNVFLEASAMYHLDWYNALRWPFWKITIVQNPCLFLLIPVAFSALLPFFPKEPAYEKRLLTGIYSLFILSCLAGYKQVFPYYMQVTIPVFLLFYTAFFNWIYQTMKRIEARLLVATILSISVIYSLGQFLPQVIHATGRYQKANIALMENLLADGSDYVAGIELIYNKAQPISGMRHLMGPAIAYLYEPKPSLKAVMLASLYEDPHASVSSIMTAWQNSRIKFYMNNYRMERIPPTLKAYLATQYEHYWGSIYLYAPEITANRTSFQLKFAGLYQLETKVPLRMDGHVYSANTVFYLDTQPHTVSAQQAFRLKLLPDLHGFKLDPISAPDDWRYLLFI